VVKVVSVRAWTAKFTSLPGPLMLRRTSSRCVQPRHGAPASERLLAHAIHEDEPFAIERVTGSGGCTIRTPSAL
jgi:hypothetical protein